MEMPAKITEYLKDRLLNPANFGYGEYYGKNWITIPVRDKDGKTMFYKLRKDPFDDTNPDKYKFYPPNSKATLFGQEILHNPFTKLAVCLTGDQKVLSLDGFKKISEINIADTVYTHKGTYEGVEKILKREYFGDLISVKPNYYPEALEMTSEHPVLCCEVFNCSYPSWNLLCKPSCKRRDKFTTLKCQKEYPLIWKKASEISGKEFLVYPINRDVLMPDELINSLPEKFYNDKDFWYFVGLFLGDGTVNKSGKYKSGITIYGGGDIKERNKTFLREYVKKHGGTGRISFYDNCWRIGLYDSLLARFFFSQFYNNKKEKVVPRWVETLPMEFQHEIIKGLFHTDGCLHKNNNGNDVRIANTSLDLLSSMQRMLLRFNILVSIENGRSSGIYNIMGRVGEQKKLYNLRGGCDLANLLGVYIKERTRSNPQYFIIGNMVFYPIDKITVKKNKKCSVYNLTVSKEHSFSSGLIITHNCEGEMDSLVLRSNGIAAVTSTAGAGSFKDEWVDMFKHAPNIYVSFDSDRAGQLGAMHLIKKLLALKESPRVYNILLPVKDITDYFCSGGTKEELFTYATLITPLNLPELPQGVPTDKDRAMLELDSISLSMDRIKRETIMCDDFHQLLVEEWLLDAKNYQARLRRVINKNKFNSFDLSELKKIPIEEILASHGIRCEQTYGNRKKFKIRDEKTPSAVLYVDQNTYYDYGDPSKSGTVIDLVMALEKCDIKDAIKKLSCGKV